MGNELQVSPYVYMHMRGHYPNRSKGCRLKMRTCMHECVCMNVCVIMCVHKCVCVLMYIVATINTHMEPKRNGGVRPPGGLKI